MFAKRALFNGAFVVALAFGGGCPYAVDMSDGVDDTGGVDGILTDTPDNTPDDTPIDTPTDAATDAKVFSANLSGSNEVPPVDVVATGTATLTLNDDDTEVTLDISASGFTVPVTMMHLHGGAVGENGMVILDLTATLVDSGAGNVGATGSVPITADVISALRDGAVYLNMHTADNPAGEIRGQFGPPS